MNIPTRDLVEERWFHGPRCPHGSLISIKAVASACFDVGLQMNDIESVGTGLVLAAGVAQRVDSPVHFIYCRGA
ncbi:hypothetical protein [Burkholderia pyrrocinia]|uniref:hypothetical protein n=1 Tax=Burkholderia pyrrocinia TaxID=60550 RepID=UPI00158D4100|nr:hypothetical protein [Burkholderia pyrrocinia]